MYLKIVDILILFKRKNKFSPTMEKEHIKKGNIIIFAQRAF